MVSTYIEEREGGYYLAGTRVSLDSIITCFNEGLSPEAIVKEFEVLNLTQVYGAITFYLENQAAMDTYRVRQEERFGQMRQGSEPLPQSLREKLEIARQHLRSHDRIT
jgi:uncharacterized protein (DUF433 family)